LGENDSQSYGEMYSVEQEKAMKADESYAADVLLSMVILTTYDDKKATAKRKIAINHRSLFAMTIIPEDLDILVYKAYEWHIKF
jgi:hypothetical protein